MRRPGVALTIAVGWVGVVTGHVAACFLAYPSAEARHVHLALSGHSWVGVAAVSLLAVVPIIMLSVGARALSGEVHFTFLDTGAAPIEVEGEPSIVAWQEGRDPQALPAEFLYVGHYHGLARLAPAIGGSTAPRPAATCRWPGASRRPCPAERRSGRPAEHPVGHRRED